jgi:hypothetical protein
MDVHAQWTSMAAPRNDVPMAASHTHFGVLSGAPGADPNQAQVELAASAVLL